MGCPWLSLCPGATSSSRGRAGLAQECQELPDGAGCTLRMLQPGCQTLPAPAMLPGAAAAADLAVLA